MSLPSDNKTTQTYWVTKYALTQGIVELPPGAGVLSEGGYLYMGEARAHYTSVQVVPADFFPTLAEAEQRVEQLKETRLRSLEKALHKIKHYKAKVTVWEVDE